MSYIKKEPLLQIAKGIQGKLFGAPLIVREIENAPAEDVVEVVRCKDCKFCRALKDGGSQCERIDGLLMTKPNDYCSYGKRREENE